MDIAKSLFYFLMAGLCEIGGGYLVWLWLREGKSLWLAGVGALVLIVYGIIPTLQPAHFGRVYAAYGGVFVVPSVLWGWQLIAWPLTGPTSWGCVSCSSGWRSSCIGRGGLSDIKKPVVCHPRLSTSAPILT